MPKVTFSLDEGAVQTLRQLAARSGKPQSLIVREAIVHYAEREERLSAEQRDHLLAVLQRIRQRPPSRSASATREELQEVRRARRTGWSRPVR